jgi:hypothetical protein
MGRRGILVGLIVSVPLVMGSASAFAAVYPNGGTTPTTVRVEAATAVAPATVDPASSGSTLPFTGGDVAGLAATGVSAIGVGLLLTRRSRRSS